MCHLLQLAGWPLCVGPGGPAELVDVGGAEVVELGLVYPGARMQYAISAIGR